MSTTFAIHKMGLHFDLEDDELTVDYNRDEFLNVAFRHNGGRMVWKNDLAHLLPPSTKVYPMDNSAQGIYTIGDIITEIKSNGNAD